MPTPKESFRTVLGALRMNIEDLAPYAKETWSALRTGVKPAGILFIGALITVAHIIFVAIREVFRLAFSYPKHAAIVVAILALTFFALKVTNDSVSVTTTAAVAPVPCAEYPHAQLGSYPMRDMAGRWRVGDLYTAYTGISGLIPETANVNFADRLDALWVRKVERSGGNNVVEVARDEMTRDYRCRPVTSVTLEDYVSVAGLITDEVCRELDWVRLQEIKNAEARKAGNRQHTSAERISLVENISCSLTGEDMVAYALTELMPSTTGELNAGLLDWMLRNGGREYVEAIPAIYDPKTSFGPYQFTEYALYDANGERRGASIANIALPVAKRIPGSVIGLKGDDHHKAAVLFAVNNLADLVWRLNDRQFKTLSRVWRQRKVDLVEFIATSHHGPGAGRKIAYRWLDNGAKAHFEVSANGRFIQYAAKTHANLAALNNPQIMLTIR